MKPLFVCLIALAGMIAGSPNAGASTPAPYLNPLVPASVEPGGSGFQLTVNGAQFVAGAVVKWNGVALATTFVSPDQVTAWVPETKIAKAGTAYITVSNPAPGGTSNTVTLNITKPTASLAWKEVDTTAAAGGGAVIADFNGDGIPDLATGAAILLGSGNGKFTRKSTLTFPAGDGQQIVTAADFNQDGKVDLAIFNGGDCYKNGSEVVFCDDLFLGNGDGTFNFAYGNDGDDGGYFSLAPADFLGIGRPQIATGASPGTGPPEIFIYGPGSGDNLDIVGYVENPCVSLAHGLAVGDFNGDGILDVASSGENCTGTVESAPLAIFLGNGDGTFTPAATQPTTRLQFPAQVVAADFDGDGILDLAIVGDQIGMLEVFHGNGDGTFTPRGFQPTIESPWYLATADLNGDGKLDLVVSPYSGSTASVFLGNGDGTFNNELTMNIPGSFVGIADFNGDGRPDLAYTNAAGVSVLLQTGVVRITPSVLWFNRQPQDVTSPPQYLKLTNTGSAPVDIGEIVIEGNPDFTESNNCGKVVAAGNTCKFAVTITPLAPGQRVGQMIILDNAKNTIQTVGLYGTGK